MALEQSTTAQGLHIYVDHIPTAQTTQVAAMVGVGYVHEALAETGLAHNVEHAVHLKTADFDSKVDLKLYRGVNAMYANALTDSTATVYEARGAELEPVLYQMGQIVCHPIFEPESVNREMRVADEEARRCLGNTADLHKTAVQNVLFGEPYGRTVFGHGTNTRYTADQIQSFYDRYYGYDNMVLLAIGKATMAQVLEVTNRHFGAMSDAATRPEAPPTSQPLNTSIRSGYDTGNSKEATMYFTKAVALSPELSADTLINRSAFAAAGDAISAHFLDTLRNKMGIAYAANFRIDRSNHRNAWYLEATTSAPEDIRAIENGLQAVLSRSPEDYSGEEIRSVIGLLTCDVLSEMDSLEGCHANYDRTWRRYGVPLSLEDEAAEVRALDESEVRVAMDVLLRHFTDNASVTHLTGSGKAIGIVDHMVQRTDIA